MNFSQRLTFLFSAPVFDADDLEGLRVSQIITAIERLGFQVIKARRVEDAEIAVQTDAAIGCMVVDWGKKGIEGKAASLINLMRKRGLDMPIIVLIRRKRFEDIPVEVLDFIDGYVFLAEETPEFIAKNLVSRLKQYADTLKTPFFGALVDYRGRQPALDLPGPQRRRLLQPQPDRPHLRRASGRGDLSRRPRQFDPRARRPPDPRGACAAGAERGRRHLRRREDLFRPQRHLVLEQDRADQPDRRGRPGAVRPQQPQGRASRRAAHGRRRSGLSFDRPQRPRTHRSDRPEAFDETAIRERIRDHPLIKDPEAWKRERPFRVAVIEQCTYDGTIYNAERIVERIGHLATTSCSTRPGRAS
jgi:ornithine decarboxylase